MTKMMSVALLSAALLLPAQKPEAAESLLQAATKKEVVDGDLAGAIEGYKKTLAAAKGNRAVAAKALYQLGECYRKQGNAQARQTFERLVKEYADQAVAGQARARLAAMGGGTSLSDGMSLRRIDTGGRFGVTGGISSDGRLIAFTDYVKGGSPAVYDTVTKQEKRLTDFDWDAAGGFGDENAISRDGKWVAFNYYRMGGRDPEIRVVGTDGAGMRTVYKGSGWNVPQDWTPDGKHVVALLGRSDKQVDLCLVGAGDGSVRVLKSFMARPRRSRVSPDGGFLTYIESDGKSRIMSTEGTEDAPLFESDPQARPMDWTPDGKGLIFASARSGENALWYVPMKSGRPDGDARMVRAGVVGDGVPVGMSAHGRLYFVEHSTISNSYIMPVDLATGTAGKPVRTTKRYEGMNGFAAWSLDGRKLAWFGQKRGDNFSGGAMVIRDLATGHERTITAPEQAVQNTAPEWLSDNRSLMYRADDSGKQVLMRMDTETSETSRISDGRPIWNSTLSRDGKTLYFVNQKEGEIIALDTQTGVGKQVASIPGQIMPRSLALSPDEKSMAYVVQYRREENGELSIEGSSINLVDLTTGQFRVFKRFGKNELVVGWSRRPLLFTPDGKGLLATSGADKLNYIRLFPLSGGEEKRLVQSAGFLRDASVSPDGKSIAYTERTTQSDLWALENFLPVAMAQKK